MSIHAHAYIWKRLCPSNCLCLVSPILDVFPNAPCPSVRIPRVVGHQQRPQICWQSQLWWQIRCLLGVYLALRGWCPTVHPGWKMIDANWLWLVMTSLWWILCHLVNVVICFVNSLIHLGPSLCCVMFTLWTLIKIIWNTSWKDHFLGILGVPYGFVKLPGSKKGLLLLPSKTFPSMGKFHRRDTKVRVLWRHHEVNMPIWGLVNTYEIPYLEGMNMHFPQWRNETYT